MCATRSTSSTAPTSCTTASCSRKARRRGSSPTATCVESIWARGSRCSHGVWGGHMAGVGQRLEIRQGQGLVMTPQLQQAIKLLQLSNVELAEYCEQELERNPLLERDDRDTAGDAERERAEAATKSETVDSEIAREDFSKVADMDGASHDNMYD